MGLRSDDLDTVCELYAEDEFWQLVGAIEVAPACLLGGLSELEDHRQLQSPDLRANLAKLGIEARAGMPQAFGAAMADDMAKYDEIVRLTGIKVD